MNPQNFDIRKSRFYPTLVMEDIFSHKSRHKILNFLFILIVLLVIVIIVGYLNSSLFFLLPKIFGLIFIVSAIFLCTFSLEVFFRSFYFKKKASLIIQDPNNLADYFGFEACRLVYKSPNLVRSFMTSDIGRMAMVRSGINAESVTEFLKKFQNPSPGSLMDILHESFVLSQKNNHKIIFVEDLIVSLLKKEKLFSDFLFDFEIKERELIGILEWVMRSFEKQKKKEAWWKMENLGQISGLAKDWAYGETYTLEKYSHDLFYNAADVDPLRLAGKEEEIRKIEIILSRSKEANVLIVGDPGVGRKTVVLGFVKMIMTEKISPVLEYKRVVQLDTDAIIAATKQKGQLEELLIKIFNEAVSAGNIIIVFENFPAFLKSAENIGTNITSFLEPYFNSPNLQTIAVADMGEFHKIMEPDSALMKFFEKIEIEEPDEKNSITILETVAEEAERNSGIIFTYPVIKEIVRSSSLYLVEGAMPEKAIGLLSQMVPFIAGKQGVTIKKEDVLEFIRLKTKMPVGEIKPEEKEQLLNLEKFMHKRVVGQEEAITAISEAMRRARTEIRDTKKPIGSFLFLGPTGVGKTETAKALAQAFFGDEENIVRFDMSEYQADDALNRLIGSFAENKPGILASSLREKPYGLLLMDEFEKTNPEVLNLFLQILDEGFFTDAFGKKINARNVIFIATSNAGANFIWDFVKQGINPVDMKEQILDKVRGQGIFKPELLNRFDGIIIFHPLTDDHLRKIAGFMLNKLQKRLEEKDIELIINDALLDFMVKVGSDPVFGARPMQRAIQDKIEQYVAKKIISEEIKRGSTVEFTQEDLSNMK